MAKSNSSRVPQGLSNLLKAPRGEALGFRNFFEGLSKTISFELGIVVTSMPRGQLQVAQPQTLPEVFQRGYAQGACDEDRATWTSVIKDQPVTGAMAWGSNDKFENSAYRKEFLRQCGLGYVAAAPLTAPVLDGYAGAIHLYRAEERGDFNNSDLNKLAGVASELDKAFTRSREDRLEAAKASESFAYMHRVPVRQFIFDKDLKQRLPQSDLSKLDERHKEQMLEHAKRALSNLGSGRKIERLPLPDIRGDVSIFYMISRKSYPAMGDGPFVFFCVQPTCVEWSVIQPVEFQADNELSRMIPAFKFIKDEWARGPGLGEIAKTAHLSPFHFHRRFTELMGMTPKHYMLDCQMDDCKKFLLGAEKELVDIAKVCGFAHQSHFTSRFKQTTGLTPTRWRRQAIERERLKDLLGPAGLMRV
jgi:AraC-like DNA-binding protein